MARHTLRSASVRLTFASAETHAGHGRLGFFGKNAPRQKVAAAAAGAWQVSRLSVSPFHINFSKTQKKERQARRTAAAAMYGNGLRRLTSERRSEAKRGASGLGGAAGAVQKAGPQSRFRSAP